MEQWNNGPEISAQKISTHLNLPMSKGQQHFLASEQWKKQRKRQQQNSSAAKARAHKKHAKLRHEELMRRGLASDDKKHQLDDSCSDDNCQSGNIARCSTRLDHYYNKKWGTLLSSSSSSFPQWGTADAEIKAPSPPPPTGWSPELFKVPSFWA